MKAYRSDSATPILHARRVAVVGGGNVAMDAARTALRLGAEEVSVVYRRSMEELPARREEVEHAEEEGVVFRLLCNPTEILGYHNPPRPEKRLCDRYPVHPDGAWRAGREGTPTPGRGSRLRVHAGCGLRYHGDRHFSQSAD